MFILGGFLKGERDFDRLHIRPLRVGRSFKPMKSLRVLVTDNFHEFIKLVV